MQRLHELQPAVAAVAARLGPLLDTLHGDLKQSVCDLGNLAKAHAACADVAKLCGQVLPHTCSLPSVHASPKRMLRAPISPRSVAMIILCKTSPPALLS